MAIVISRDMPVTLAQTIGSILTSLVDAQAQSARSTVEFINEVGFVTDPVDKTEKLRTVQFKYQKLDENNQRSEFLVELPLLGMVEIPLISIRKARVEFDYQISSTSVEAGSATAPVGGLKRIDRAVFKGTVPRQPAPTTAEKGSLKVVIEIERADLPVALEKTLGILELAAAESKHGTG